MTNEHDYYYAKPPRDSSEGGYEELEEFLEMKRLSFFKLFIELQELLCGFKIVVCTALQLHYIVLCIHYS